MMKSFQAVIDAMAALEIKLKEQERFWTATQIKVLRGVVAAIMIGESTHRS